MRGQRSLFDNLLTPEPVAKFTQRGRNLDCIDNRNNLLLHRYYYYAKIKNEKYNDIMALLERELFITTSRIVVCLTQNEMSLKAIFNAEVSVKELKEKFSWLVW